MASLAWTLTWGLGKWGCAEGLRALKLSEARWNMGSRQETEWETGSGDCANRLSTNLQLIFGSVHSVPHPELRLYLSHLISPSCSLWGRCHFAAKGAGLRLNLGSLLPRASAISCSYGSQGASMEPLFHKRTQKSYFKEKKKNRF